MYASHIHLRGWLFPLAWPLTHTKGKIAASWWGKKVGSFGVTEGLWVPVGELVTSILGCPMIESNDSDIFNLHSPVGLCFKEIKGTLTS